MAQGNTTEFQIITIKTNEYVEAIRKGMELAATVLKHVIFDLMRDDFPVLWAEQYRKPDVGFPTAERSFLLYVDKTGEIVKKINQYFANTGEQTKVYSMLSVNGLNQYNAILQKIPNDVLIPSVTDWLNNIPSSEFEKTAMELLDSLDVSGCANCIRYTSTPNARDYVLITRLANQYKDHIQDSKSYSQILAEYVKCRNAYSGHISESVKRGLTEDAVFNVFGVIQKVIDPFSDSKTRIIQQSVDDVHKYLLDKQTRIKMPMVILADVEKTHQIPTGKLGEALCNFPKLNEYMDDERRIILFTSETEVKQYYSAYCSNFEISKEMGATLDNEELEAKSVVSVNDLRNYKNGKLTHSQLVELIQNFAFFADIGTLLSKQAMKVIADSLGPILRTEKKRLLVEWGTLSYLYRLEKESPNAVEQEQAKHSRLQLYHMQKISLVQYVGTMCHSIYPDKSLLEYIEEHKNIPICVMTPNGDLAERMNSPKMPYCISVANWRDDGIFIRTASREHFDALCGMDKSNGENNPEILRNPSSAPIQIKNIDTVVRQKDRPARSSYCGPAPQMGETVWDETNNPIQLTSKVSDEGGEGTVYRTSRPGFVAKIYKEGKADSERLSKLRTMRSIPINRECICWPKSLLYTKDKRFVGFLMIEAPSDAIEMGVSIFKLGSKRVQEKILPGWDRLSLAKACASVSSTFAYLHEKKILMADVNPRNFLVSLSDPDNVYFVDCDSYQFGKYLCPVGMAEYSSPEYLRRLDSTCGGYAECPRTMEDEQFALASLLFHILMLGQNPFAAKGNEKIEEAIRNYSFAYKTKTNRGEDVPDGPYAMIWNNTPPYIKKNFISVFTGEEKVSAESWSLEFRKYVNRISAGVSTSELLPKKYYDPQGELFETYKCVYCGSEANMRKDKYAKLVQYHQPLFCNQCMSLLWPLRDIDEIVECDGCHRQFKGNQYQKALQEYGKRAYCPVCKERNRQYWENKAD